MSDVTYCLRLQVLGTLVLLSLPRKTLLSFPSTYSGVLLFIHPEMYLCSCTYVCIKHSVGLRSVLKDAVLVS